MTRSDAVHDPTHVAGPLSGERVPVGDVVLDTHLAAGADGPLAGQTLLLISGLGRQRIHWPPPLVAGLCAAGLDVLTVDNRDVGRSTVLDGAPSDRAAYALADLATDLVGVLDHLRVDRAHVAGVSMGGMIAQHLAFGHPRRVASLTSIMSSTGARDRGQATAEAARVLAVLEPADPEAFVAHHLWALDLVGTPDAADVVAERARAEAAAQRGIHPEGTVRQLLAILADRDRTARLADVVAPTLVLHGTADPLIDPSGGAATAAAIAGARLHTIEGMGHDLPLRHLPELVGALVAHVAAAGWSRRPRVP